MSISRYQIEQAIDRWLVRHLPRRVLPWLGRWRGFWWGVVRSETGQRRKIQRDEIAWCGKGFTPEELDDLIAEQRPIWRRRRG